MNLYLDIFLTFLKIGAFSFGGGYGMIAVIRDSCLSKGWLTEEELINFIAVAESTPGPIAVNMATFVGSSRAGVLGSLLATVGVVLPSFIIILIVAALIKNLLKLAGVQAALEGVRPVVIGLIIATGFTMTLKVIFNVSSLISAVGSFRFDLRSAGILFMLILVAVIWKKFKKKSISPILLIFISAVCGVIFYK
ncbi:MAG: chromate transporter [Lachnospiraceae bacterium]|nr:chromate transporter [Lachnospiraceae bacterium]